MHAGPRPASRSRARQQGHRRPRLPGRPPTRPLSCLRPCLLQGLAEEALRLTAENSDITERLTNVTTQSCNTKIKVKVKVGKSLHRLNFPVLTSSFRPLFDLPDAPSAVPPTSSEWVPGRPVPKPWRF